MRKLLFLITLLPAGWAQTGTGGYRVVGASLTGASQIGTGDMARSRLELESSDARLVEAFRRAKAQSMAFAFDGDPVGPWYEAAEPGREAFCMRDTAHQAMGAHALGLALHNRNMLRKFAQSVSESRDWCGYWEIDRLDRPAPVDYESDAAFWFNLPANFDILDACYRMYVWTGDPAYVEDPAFLNFYDRTVSDYVERWGLSLDQVMQRPRLLNMRGIYDPRRKFTSARGIPGYDEGDRTYVLGVDVLATQYAAYVAYARIQEARRNHQAAGVYLKKAADLRQLVNSRWWNEKDHAFFGRLDQDHHLAGRAGSVLLDREIVDDGPKLKSALDSAGPNAQALHRYGGDADAVYAHMIDLAQPGRSRWDYPEVPFSWLGDFINGPMGIEVTAAPAGLSSQEGYWVAAVIRTLPALGKANEWSELRNLPVRSNEVTVRHQSNRKTVLTNQHGPALIWEAAFAGSFETLQVNGRAVKARVETGALGRRISSVRVTVSGGGTVSVQAPE